jgi:hypothetical protein
MEDAELYAHYSRGEEGNRLSAGRGLLEFTRTTEIILRFLPAARRWSRTSAAGRGGTRCGWPDSATGWSTGT